MLRHGWLSFFMNAPLSYHRTGARSRHPLHVKFNSIRDIPTVMAIDYKYAALQFMEEDTGGLNQKVADLDDMRKDPAIAPEAVELLLPTSLAILLQPVKWAFRSRLR